WTYFHCTVVFQDRAALRELYGLRQIARFDHRVATHDVLGFGKRPVGDGLLPALHQLARALERLALVLDVTLLLEILQPPHPLFHRLLHLLGRSSGFAAAIQKYELAHDCFSLLFAVTGPLTQPWSHVFTIHFTPRTGRGGVPIPGRALLPPAGRVG